VSSGARASLRLALAGLLLLAWFGPAAADRLHLESGRYIDVDVWWQDGDWIRYEGEAGTVGLPRSLVVRIEPTDSSGRAPARSSSALQAAPALKTVPTEELVKKVEAAHEALESRDYETASARYIEVLSVAPDLTVARVGYALSEMALGHDGIALSAVLDGLTRDAERAELHELLGDLRDREERVEEALSAWRESFRLKSTDRVREKILKAEREMNVGRYYDVAATSHFNVRYDGNVDARLADEVMDYLEEQYGALADEFRHAPPQPINLLLYPTREFREVTQAPEWVGGLYDGKIRVPLGGLSRLDPRARAVLRHEMTHAFVHSKTRGQCPRWLHEGLAQIMEGRRLTRADQAKVADLLREVEPDKWEAEGFSYPAALSLTRFIEERRGFDGLIWTLEEMGDGLDVDGALRRTYGLDHAGLCRVWAESLLEPER